VQALQSKVEQLSIQKTSPTQSSSSLTSRVKFNGFASVGLGQFDKSSSEMVNSLGTEVEYETGQTGDIDLYSNTYVGLQMSAKLYDGGMAVYQAIVRGNADNSESHDLAISSEWYYLKHDFGGGFSARAGRLRLPLFMESDSFWVGVSYPWVTPPTELYAMLDLTNIDGIATNHSMFVGDWTLNTGLLIWGQSEKEYSSYSLAVEKASGLSLTLSDDNALTFRLAYLQGQETVTVSQSNPALALGSAPNALICESDDGQTCAGYPTLTLKNNKQFAAASVKYDDSSLYGSIEFARVRSDEKATGDEDAYNLTFGYHFGPVMVYLSHTSLETKNSPDEIASSIADQISDAGSFSYLGQFADFGAQATGAQYAAYFNKQQTTDSIGLKYDLHPNVAVKFQAQYMHDFEGTGGRFFNTPDVPFESITLYDLAVQATF